AFAMTRTASAEPASERVFFGVSVLLFAISTTATIVVYIDVGGERDADDGRSDDVHGVDADARPHVARRCGVVPGYVGLDDGRDDVVITGAHAVALARWTVPIASSPSLPDSSGRAAHHADRAPMNIRMRAHRQQRSTANQRFWT